jgi:hypothetical protein
MLASIFVDHILYDAHDGVIKPIGCWEVVLLELIGHEGLLTLLDVQHEKLLLEADAFKTSLN